MEKNFHQTSYGWNYGYKKNKAGKIQPYRYHTNGHVNEAKQIGPWVAAPEPTCWEECQKLYHNHV